MKQRNQEKSEERYELTPGCTVDISDQALEDLNNSLERIKELKQKVIDGILRPKKKELDAYTERFRAMLCQLVMMENALLEEKSQKESARLAQKLDLLEAECAKELPVAEKKPVAKAHKSKYTLTAVRYDIASRLIGFGGVFACLLGCVAYLVLVLIYPQEVAFDWIWLIANAAGALLFLIIGASLHQKSRFFSALAREDLARAAKGIDGGAFALSHAALQAYAIELNMEAQEKKETEEEDASWKELHTFSVKKTKSATSEGIDVDVNVDASILLALTAALAGAAALTVAFFLGKRSCGEKKKKASKKRSIEPIESTVAEQDAPKA